MKTKTKKFTFGTELQTAIEELQMAAPSEVQGIVTGIESFGKKAGFVTEKQISLLGKLHKEHVCGGKYIEHNWW